MDPHEEKLMRYISDHGISAEHKHFDESCHSVADAARAVGAATDAFVKNICMIDAGGKLIVAIVKGEDKADLKTDKFLIKIGSTCPHEERKPGIGDRHRRRRCHPHDNPRWILHPIPYRTALIP